MLALGLDGLLAWLQLVGLPACVHVCMHVCVHMGTWARAPVYTCVCVHVCTCARVHVCVRTGVLAYRTACLGLAATMGVVDSPNPPEQHSTQ